MKNEKMEIDIKSIEIGWNGKPDYPEFANAYIESACWSDGTDMTEDEIENWEEENPDTLYELSYESLI